MKHFISFIIPTYNREKTIEEAIDSIYVQNISVPFEVIVTDDCSTDNTKDILLRYEKRLPNFYSYYLSENRGPSAARNNCVRYSKGDLIFNLDSDNFLEPSTIGQLVKFLDKKNCECAAFAEARMFVGSKGSYKLYRHHTVQKVPKGNVCGLDSIIQTSLNAATAGNYLYTRKSFDLAGGYPEGPEGSSEGAMETYRFGFRQMVTGARIAILPKSFYWHRFSEDSKWLRDHKLGINSKAMVEEFQKFPHLFTDATNRLLASSQLTKPGAFFKKIRFNCFQLREDWNKKE